MTSQLWNFNFSAVLWLVETNSHLKWSNVSAKLEVLSFSKLYLWDVPCIKYIPTFTIILEILSYQKINKIDLFLILDRIHLLKFTVFSRIVSTETILFWKWKVWKFSYSFRIIYGNFLLHKLNSCRGNYSREETVCGNTVV